jgi:hypothetical protein
VLKEFIYQDGSSQDGVLMVVENPNPDLAILDTKCQLTGYDAGGAVTETSSFCDINVLFPGERRTIYEYIFNHGPTPATRLEVQITQQGRAAKTELTGAGLTTENLHYWPDRHELTGTVRNDTDFQIADPDLMAVFYDDQGEPFWVQVNVFEPTFIPARGSAAFMVPDTRALNPARMDILASVKSASSFKPVAAGRSTLKVGQVLKFVDPSTQQGEAFFYITNPDSDYGLDLVDYQIVAYDAQGFVLVVLRDQSPLVFPGEQAVMHAGDFLIPEGSAIDHVDVQMSLPVENYQYVDTRAAGLKQNPLKIENCQYHAEDVSIACVLKNSWKDQIGGADIIALGFDAAGNAISVSYGRVNEIPASGQMDLTFGRLWTTGETPVAPARIEAYANITSGIP